MSRILMASLFVLTIAPVTTLAQTVTSNVEGDNGGTFTSDPQGPSATTVSSNLAFPETFTTDFSETGFGRATQQPDGVGGVVADGLFANGQLGNFIEARTTWSETATNTSGAPADYVFDFLITPAALRIRDFARLPDAANNGVEVSFLATIRVNGTVVFEAGASVFGGENFHTLTEIGTSLSPVFVAGSIFGYDFASYANVLPLPTVASGGSITVEYEMVARVDTPGFEAGGRASIGDPFDLSGSPGFSGDLRLAEPVPARAKTWGAIKAHYQ